VLLRVRVRVMVEVRFNLILNPALVITLTLNSNPKLYFMQQLRAYLD